MENPTQPVHKLSDLASLLLDKLKAAQTDITLDFQDMTVQGPGPQGQPGQWKLNGQLSLKTKSSGSNPS
ncbi:hypothetical protein [Rufibacter latericius]|uniref:Uncharacterized protein n=1 Tax=Rufibacter latericius TaxID=2487040 RepID=A0A3M9MA29_9BACT|nr:hypothetical protein [Rufibacter latericius]RNI22366.1 hypothetical protein EFB08_19835 [Rufibacter latericius]